MKKKLLRLCSIVLVISMVLGNLVSMPVAAESTEETTGMTFSEYRKGVIDNPFTSGIKTVEATICLPTGSSGIENNILATSSSGHLPNMSFKITHAGYPAFYYNYDSNGSDVTGGNTAVTTLFNTTVNNGKVTHVAFVLEDDAETNTTTVYCYVDGINIPVHSSYSQPSCLVETPSSDAFVVGGNYSTTNTGYFKGEIHSLAVYSSVRDVYTGTNIDTNTIDLSVDTADTSLMAYYDLTSVTDATTKVANGSTADTTQQYALNVVETWMTERKPALSDWDKENGDFSIAIVGDTQIATEYDVSNGYTDGETGVVSGIYEWLVDNQSAKNIQFVMGAKENNGSYSFPSRSLPT